MVVYIRRQKKAAPATVSEDAITDGKPELDGRIVTAISGEDRPPPAPIQHEYLIETDERVPHVELHGTPRAELHGASRI
jgi:hypothetical protein